MTRRPTEAAKLRRRYWMRVRLIINEGIPYDKSQAVARYVERLVKRAWQDGFNEAVVRMSEAERKRRKRVEEGTKR